MAIERTGSEVAAVKAAELLKKGVEASKQVATDAVAGLKYGGEEVAAAVDKVVQPKTKRVRKGIPAVAPDLSTLDVRGKYDLAQNPKTAPDVLEKLAADPSEDVLAALAQNKSASPAILTRLAQSTNSENVLYCIAKNPNTPPELLSALTNHTGYYSELEMVHVE